MKMEHRILFGVAAGVGFFIGSVGMYFMKNHNKDKEASGAQHRNLMKQAKKQFKKKDGRINLLATPKVTKKRKRA